MAASYWRTMMAHCITRRPGVKFHITARRGMASRVVWQLTRSAKNGDNANPEGLWYTCCWNPRASCERRDGEQTTRVTRCERGEEWEWETWVRGKFKMASAAPARFYTSWWVAAAAGPRSVGLASPDKLSFQLPTRLQRHYHWPRAVIAINHSSESRKVNRTHHRFSSMRMQYHPWFPGCVHGPLGYEW